MMNTYLLIIIYVFTLTGCKNERREQNKTQHDTAVVEKVPETLHVNTDSIDSANAAVIAFAGGDVQKAIISKEDSSIDLTANMRRDHRFFAYAMPDTASRRMLLLSVFTNDVDGNPYCLPLGAYYQTNDMGEMQLKHAGEEKDFIKASVVKSGKHISYVYFQKRWMEWE